MRLTKQRLAESAQKELEEAIRRNPLDWMDDIIDGLDEPHEALQRVVVSLYTPSGPGPRAVIGEFVEKFAVAAGQRTYDIIMSHPGII
jgi:hypothetical protein